jgi:nucleotide-binding universal stress UspA family protein
VSGILQLVREAGADLIVVGPDAADNASVAERIARVAPCAVLIARKSLSASGDLMGPIVAGTDLSDPSFGAVRAAFDVARSEPRKITIVHAIESPPPAYEKIWSFVGQRPPPVENKVPAARTRIHAWLEATGRKVSESLEVAIVECDAARALLDFAASRSAELIVVGTRGWTSDADLPLGSVAEVVVRTAPCSVLVARL